ncbi:hypothetical protein Agub_g6463, partial [Astrephomene gubernaculifera]
AVPPPSDVPVTPLYGTGRELTASPPPLPTSPPPPVLAKTASSSSSAAASPALRNSLSGVFAAANMRGVGSSFGRRTSTNESPRATRKSAVLPVISSAPNG